MSQFPPLDAIDYALFALAETNDVEGLRRLVSQGANPNARWSDGSMQTFGVVEGRTPLHHAVEKNHVDCVEFFLPLTDVSLADEFLSLPLQLAAVKNHAECVRVLLRACHPDETDEERGMTPLAWAATAGQTAAMAVLLADPRCNPNSALLSKRIGAAQTFPQSQRAWRLWNCVMPCGTRSTRPQTARNVMDASWKKKVGGPILEEFRARCERGFSFLARPRILDAAATGGRNPRNTIVPARDFRDAKPPCLLFFTDFRATGLFFGFCLF